MTQKVAIIGCGKQAPKHLKGLRSANDQLDFILFDVNEDAAKSLGEAEGLKWTTDILEILSDNDVVAFDICTPTSFHKPLITQAIDAGKDFFCEKPLCETVEEAIEIKNMVSANDRIGMIGYVYRFAPVFVEAKKIIESGALGDVVMAQFRIGGRGSHQVWKHLKKTDGGALNEMMVHMLDLAIWFFGDVKESKVLVNELLRSTRTIQGKEENVDAEDYLVVRSKMESGVDVLLEADMITPAFSQHVEIQGSNGTFVGSIQPDRPSFLFLEKEMGGYSAGKTMIGNDGSNLFGEQMSEFINAITDHRQPSKCRVEDSVKVLEAVKQIKEQVA